MAGRIFVPHVPSCSLTRVSRCPATLRAVSTSPRHQSSQVQDTRTLSTDSGANWWPDTRLGALEPTHKRFPLPGLVGSPIKQSKFSAPQKPNYGADVLTAELSYERQSTILEQFMTITKQLEEEERGLSDSMKNNESSVFDRFECAAYECPRFLFQDFCEIFSNYSQSLGNVTVITLCQRDGAKLSSEACGISSSEKAVMEREASKTDGREGGMEERDKLIQSFIDSATDICEVLHEAGYWADFIDPTSGRPFISEELVGAAGYEADERMRKYGFEITTSGECKMLLHHTWGTKPYVGCLFTSAPISHPLLRGVVPVAATASTESSVKTEAVTEAVTKVGAAEVTEIAKEEQQDK